MTTESTAPVTTADERVMAALAHLFGLLAALIVYVVNTDKSRFVRFQSLQALALDAVWIVLSLGLVMCLTIGIFGGTALGFVAAANEPQSSEVVAPVLFGFMMPWLMFACIMPFSLAYWVLRLVACISVATGHDFRYPLIGRQVEAFLKND
jgi:uncharacterized membrane protein